MKAFTDTDGGDRITGWDQLPEALTVTDERTGEGSA